MDLSTWESIRSKLVLPASGKYIAIGLAAIIFLVAVVAGSNLFDIATASTFEVSHGEALSQDAASEDGQQKSVFVHVSGSVNQPGLVELESGARVADAVKAAGGFSDSARIDSVNRARVLQDGEQVVVGGAGDEPIADDRGTAGKPAVPSADALSLVNINTATAGELEQLPGIGPATAQKIISDRTANGSFASVEDLARVSGIGEKKLAGLIDLICV